MSHFRMVIRSAAGGAATLAVFVIAAVAQAGTIKLEASDYWTHGGNGGWSATVYGGGEFRVQSFSEMNRLHALGAGVQIGPAQGSPFTSLFQTFCVEYPEHYSPGVTYSYDLNIGAVAGGAGGQTSANFDPLDPRSAYLYTKFWMGELSNYHYQVSAGDRLRTDSATSLQVALWALEQELSGQLLTDYNTSGAAIFVQARAWVNEATLANWTNIGAVRVLNLYTVNAQGVRTGRAQDQLVLTTPLPAAGLLGLSLMSGIGVVAVWRRRRKHSL